MAAQWYYSQNGQQVANPVTLETLQSLALQGRLKPTDMVWNEAMTDWARAGSVRDLFPPPRQLFQAEPPVPAIAAAPQPIAVASDDTAEAWPDVRRGAARRLASEEGSARRRPKRRRSPGRAAWYGAGGGVGTVIIVILVIVVRVFLMVGANNRPGGGRPGGGLPGGGLPVQAHPQEREAVDFNEKIVDAMLRFDKATREFHNALKPLKEGRPINAGQLRAAYNYAEQVIAAARKEAAETRAPAANSGQQFHQAYNDFLATEEQVNVVYTRIVGIAEDPGLDNWQKGRQIDQIFATDPIFQEEAHRLDHLEAVQRRFATEHNLRLKPAAPLP